MTKTTMYTYLGTNGTICSPVHLEDVYFIRKIKLVADQGKQLTKDGVNFFPAITVPEEEVVDWKEIEGQN